ncbi:MAG TPA: uracil-DNA glycosylase family protein [Acidimicrobiales bacterium]|nr:uracil-DNA glycosylase family protein [Acidimicrobiales bacterium]
MDRPTIAVYDRAAPLYAARRPPTLAAAATAFAAAVPAGAWRADLGSGTGRYTPFLGSPALALDASWGMLSVASSGARVQADVEQLPLRRGALAGAWANQVYQHVPRARLPLALARLHDALQVSAPVRLSVGAPTPSTDDFPGRLFEPWAPGDLARVVEGAGFDCDDIGADVVVATRARTLPDIVGPGMRMLVCGLNPSIYAADRGVGFARPGNRFWPAALAAGLVTRDRDPWHALAAHGVGFTDLVKRATPNAAALTVDEYRAGVERVAWVAAFLRPRVVCMVGLAGWRAVVDRTAAPGLQARGLGGCAVYVMPNPSGVNAHATVASLAAHLRAAAAAVR